MLVRTSSFRTFDPLQFWNGSLRDVNQIFDAALAGTRAKTNGQDAAASQWTPATDVAEDDKKVTLTLELPGVKPDQFKIEVDNNRLTIKGQKELQTSDEKGRVHRFERVYGNFQRTFTLPETVNVDAIEAKAEFGVLTVTLPKAEKAKPREIAVRVA